MAQTINAGKIQYGLGFTVDSSSLNKLQNELQKIRNLGRAEIMDLNPNLDKNQAQSVMQSLRHDIDNINKAFSNAFNSTTGITNVTKLNQAFKNMDLAKIRNDFAAIGTQGTQAFTQITAQAMSTSFKLKETNNFLQEMGKTFMNTIRWKISSTVVNGFASSVQRAYGYVKHLDSSLNDIRIVTNKSADEMERFARSANKAAKELGASTTDYTEAALIYYQQGLSDEDVKARAETTLKTANVTGQSGRAVSEELTAVWNGYRITAEETEAAVDKLAAVAATTASDLQELSTGMSKVASAASNMGVDMDQLNAQIATIISVTRQAPESVGTALKTIYARMADLKLGETDEDGLKLGDVSGTLDKVGISVLDTNGDLREMGDVIEEVAAKWDTWTKAQQAAIAQSLAGKRQYNNLVALFDNWDIYTSALETSKNSVGTLQHQQDIYMESTEAHLQQLSTQWEDLYDSILDTKTLNSLIDFLKGIVSLFTTIADSVGGMKGVFLGLGTLVTTLFNKQISDALSGFIIKLQNARFNAQQVRADLELTREYTAKLGGSQQAIDDILDLKRFTQDYYKVMSDEEKQYYADLVKRAAEYRVIKEQIDNEAQAYEKMMKARAQAQSSYNGGQGITNSKQSERRDQVLKMNVNDPSSINQQAIESVLKEGNRQADKTTSEFGQVEKQYEKRKNEVEEYQEVLDKTLKKHEEFRDTELNMINANNLDIETQQRLWKAYKATKDQLEKLIQANQDYEKKAHQKYLLVNYDAIQEEHNAKSWEWREKKEQYRNGQLSQEELDAYTNNEYLPIHNRAVEAYNLKNSFADQGEIDAFIASVNEAEKSLSSYKGNVTKAFDNEKQTIKEVADEIKDQNKDLENFGETVGQKVDEANKNYEDLAETIKGNEQDLDTRDFTQKLTELASGFSSVMFSIQGAEAAGKSFADGDLKASLISLATTVIPMVARSIVGMVTAIKTGEKGSAILQGIAAAFQVVSLVGEFFTAERQKDSQIRLEALQKEQEKQEEKIQKDKEEIESIDKLNQAYQNIYNQRDSSGKLSEEQKSQIEDLIKQYDDEHLRLLSLIEDYQGLEKAIRDKQKAERDEYAEDNKTSVDTSLAVISENLSNAADLGEEFFDDLGISTNDYTEFLKFAGRELGIGDPDGFFAQIPSLDELEEYLLNPENLQRSIAFLGKVAADDTYSAVKDQFQKISQVITENAKNYDVNKILDNVNFEDINTVEDITKAIDEASNLVGTNGKIIGEELAEEVIFGFSDKMKELGEQKTIQDEIFEVVTPSEDNLNFFNNLTEDQKMFLYGNKELAADEKNLEEFFEKYETTYNRVENEKNKRAVEDLFEHIKTTKKGEASFKLNTKEGKELVSALYRSEDFENFSGYNQEDFLNLDFSLQQQALSEFYNSLYEEEENFRAFQQEKTREDVETDKDAIKSKQEAFNQYVTDFEAKYQKLYGLSQEQVEDIMKNMGEISTDELDKMPFTDPHISKMIADYQQGVEDLGLKMIPVNKQNEIFDNELNSLDKILENTEDALYDFSAQVASYKGTMHEINGEIDDLQSSYQTLTDVVNDYNDDQKLTLDNLQKVLEMDTAYLATLEFENGQLKINNNSYQAMIQAKIKEAQMTATQTFLTELLAIKNGEAGEAGIVMAERTYAEAAALETMAGAAQKGIASLMALKEVQDASAVDATATENAVKAYYAKMQLIGNVASQSVESGLLDKTSKKQQKHEKHLEYEVDLYREVNQELEDIESQLKRIEEVESHSWGVSALDAIQKENELLDKQLEKLQKKKSIQEGDLSARRKQLEDVGIAFAEDGSPMMNTEAVINSYYDAYNQMVDKYNAMTPEAQDDYKLTLEAEEDKVKKIEKAVDDYEKLYSDYQSIIDEIQENYFKQIEKEVDEFNFEVDLHLELSDARKEWKDFWHDVVQDIESDDFGGQIAKSLSKLGTLIGTAGNNAASDISVLTNHLNDTINEVTTQIGSHGLEGLFGTDTALSKENLKNYRDQLMEALKSAKEEIESISDNYLKMLDSAKDLIKEQVDDWNTIGDQIAHNIELIKLLDGDTAYNPLNTQYEQQYQNNLNLLQVQKVAQDNFANDIKHYKELMDSVEQGSQQWKTYEEAYNKSVTNYKEAVKDLDSTVEKSIKDIQTWRKNNVDSIIDTLDKAMSGGLGTDLLEKEWKLINDYADKYYDNVERAYNMEDYTNLLNDAANATGLTAANQAKLNAFRDKELKQLNEKEKLTQYDIDESKARLEILKQEIALQDAQRNKSNMRLRRDNQGNYVYQYTGDEEAIDQAENGVLTAKKAWYDLVKKRYKETSEYIMQLEKENVDFHKQLADAMAAGDEVRANKIREMLARNQEQINFAYEQAEKNKRDLFDGTAQYFANVENANILPQSEATVRTLVDQWAGSGKDSFITAIKTAFSDLESTQEEYNIKTQQVLQTAGVYYERLRDNGIDPVKDSLEDLMDTNEDFGNQLDDINDKLREEEDVLRDVENAYNSLKDSAVSAIQEANSALETLARTHMQMQNYANNIPAVGNRPAITGTSTSEKSNSGGGGSSYLGETDPEKLFAGYNPNKTNKNTGQINMVLMYDIDPKSGRIIPYSGGNQQNTAVLREGAKLGYLHQNGPIFTINPTQATIDWLQSQKLLFLRNFQRGSTGYVMNTLLKFKSGGYTGDWSGPGVDGVGGRAAILHQKELVLNEQDTSNMLKAVSALRGLSLSNIANSILAATQISAGLISQISGLGLSSIAGSTSTTENYRNMTVNADFSGVRSADQIYQAIMELENYGLQNSYSSSPLANRSY